MNRTLCILADAHLRRAEPLMVDFLRRARRQSTHLILLGDFFEFLAGANRTSLRVYQPVLRALGAWESVEYLEGNHDFDLRADRMGIPGLHIHRRATNLHLAGLNMGLFHGDGCNPRDKGTRLLRAGLQSRTLRWLRDEVLPDHLVHHFALRFASFSRKRTWPGRGGETQAVVSCARNWLHRDELDLVMFAHTHLAHLESTQRGVLFNPGPAQAGGSFGWLENGELSLRAFPEGRILRGPEPLFKNGSASLRSRARRG